MALFNKNNVPLSTVQGTTNNYSAEISKIQELALNTNRSNTGQVTWTSSSSGITYNTADYSSNSNIDNMGETGLYNLFIYLYGDNENSTDSFIVTGNNYNSIIDAITANQTSISNITNGDITVGAATSATKLTSGTVGSSTRPIYFNGGTPFVCGTSLAVNITGNAATATKLGSTSVGSSGTPIYLNDGAPTACGTLTVDTTGNAATATKLAAGRTLKVNLALTSASTAFDGSANISDIGVSGILPVANGGTGVSNLSNLSVGTATTATKLSNTQAIGSTSVPVYFTNGGVPAVCTSLSLNTTGNAATATTATTATTASKLGSSTVGGSTTPIYLNSGTATACSAYAGGTAVTLNGTSAAASTASFYAPTSAGTTGYYLRSNGSGAPSWKQSVYFGTSAPTSTSGYTKGDIFIVY